MSGRKNMQTHRLVREPHANDSVRVRHDRGATRDPNMSCENRSAVRDLNAPIYLQQWVIFSSFYSIFFYKVSTSGTQEDLSLDCLYSGCETPRVLYELSFRHFHN